MPILFFYNLGYNGANYLIDNTGYMFTQYLALSSNIVNGNKGIYPFALLQPQTSLSALPTYVINK